MRTHLPPSLALTLPTHQAAPAPAAGPALAPSRGHSIAQVATRAPIQAEMAEPRPSGQHLAKAGQGQPLPAAVQAKMESAFGHDFSRVRVHQGSTASSLGAVAFTRGQDIHFAPGQYSPGSRSGQQLLGHELAHVVQQAKGRVALPQGKGAPINADPGLEAEADRLGSIAAAAPSVTPST